MAHGLDLRVVAEGVETGSQLDFLQQQQCDMAQGYFFAKPMPESDYGDFVAQQCQQKAREAIRLPTVS